MNGSIILCDHVYETRDSKFVISGTHNQWLCQSKVLKIPQIHCYVRIYPERIGNMKAAIILRDDKLAPDQRPIMHAQLDLHIKADHIPVMEFAFRSNVPAEIQANFNPNSPAGSTIAIPLSLVLMVEDEIVATSPLKVIFTNTNKPSSET